MTAQLADFAIAAPVRPRRRGARVQGRPELFAPSARQGTPWAHVARPVVTEGLAPVVQLYPTPDAAAARAATQGVRYEWTPRGLAVMVTLVVLLFVVMSATLVASFLSVSNESLTPGQARFVAMDVARR